MHDAEQEVFAAAFLRRLEQSRGAISEEVEDAQSGRAAGEAARSVRVDPARTARLGVAEAAAPAALRAGPSPASSSSSSLNDQQVDEPEGHPQRQARLAPRRAPPGPRAAAPPLAGSSVPTSQPKPMSPPAKPSAARARVPASPVARAASTAPRKESAGADQVGAEQLLLAQLEQRRGARGEIGLGQQGQSALRRWAAACS